MEHEFELSPTRFRARYGRVNRPDNADRILVIEIPAALEAEEIHDQKGSRDEENSAHNGAAKDRDENRISVIEQNRARPAKSNEERRNRANRKNSDPRIMIAAPDIDIVIGVHAEQHEQQLQQQNRQRENPDAVKNLRFEQ